MDCTWVYSTSIINDKEEVADGPVYNYKKLPSSFHILFSWYDKDVNRCR